MRPVKKKTPPANSSSAIVTGTFQAIARGGGFCLPETAGQPDIRLSPRDCGMALHGDTIEVEVDRQREGRNPTGHVTRVLEHRHQEILGRLSYVGQQAIVQPKNRKLNRMINLTRRLDRNEVPDGAWVMVEVTGWSSSPEEPLLGKFKEVVGVEGDKGLPILLLIKQGGVETKFPAEVETEARHVVAGDAIATEIATRRDLRHERIMTIDPLTAKDFDDAIHLVRRVGGGWRVGVHIADVAHYVRPGTALDAEAFERATSIYPVDRVIPMLPEALSNGVCSLRPNEDKLTMSVDFTIAADGAVSDVELYASVIRSTRRFAYEEVQGLLETADAVAAGHKPEFAEGDKPVTRFPVPIINKQLLDDLLQLRKAARALRAAREQRGALDLDLPETEILFDAEGRVRDLRRAERFEAHRLIEELMIAANEAVARELEQREMPLLFRVHAEPEESKLLAIAPVMGRLGIPVKLGKKVAFTREKLQQMLDRAREHPAGAVVQRWVLRAMMRARYQPENIGHYGLASSSYTHFTSPIRRYPDLLTHRAVKLLLSAQTAASTEVTALRESLPVLGRHCSQREERAQKIEWDAIEILALDFMRRFIGDVFGGYISGITSMGFYIELTDYPVEGLVRISQLDDDYYDLDDENHVWRGRRSGRTYAIGDAASVLIERIDVLAGQMDLILMRKKGQRPQRSRPIFQPNRRRRK
jgi:ribonuclease R